MFGFGELEERKALIATAVLGALAAVCALFKERAATLERQIGDLTADRDRLSALLAQVRRHLHHVTARDVAFIGARMHRDAWRAGLHAGRHRLADIRHVAATRVAQRRYLVHIDA